MIIIVDIIIIIVNIISFYACNLWYNIIINPKPVWIRDKREVV